MLILPSQIFAGGGDEATANSYAVHYCAASWRDLPKTGLFRRAAGRVYRASGMRALLEGEWRWKLR
jgi:hypothetical protein